MKKDHENQQFNFGQFQRAAKVGYKLWLGLTYWIFTSLIILIGWVAAGTAFMIVMLVLASLGWVIISKSINWYLNKGAKI